MSKKMNSLRNLDLISQELQILMAGEVMSLRETQEQNGRLEGEDFRKLVDLAKTVNDLTKSARDTAFAKRVEELSDVELNDAIKMLESGNPVQ